MNRFLHTIDSAVSLTLLLLLRLVGAETLKLPPRDMGAPVGSVFVNSIATLPLADRESRISAEILRGNMPDFLRTLAPVTVHAVNGRDTNTATFFVTPDYLAIGSNEDYFLIPMTPQTAEAIAEAAGCILPTRRMVDAIYSAADVKLSPSPIPPSAEMTSVDVFARHHLIVRTQRMEQLTQHPPGALTAGHKKDVVLSNRLTNALGKVAIYGWHHLDGRPIQPLYTGHTNSWVDYSHGIRLVSEPLTVNGESNSMQLVLADDKLASLLSDEGPVVFTRYPVASVRAGGEVRRNQFGERLSEFFPVQDVRVVLNEPRSDEYPGGRPVKLVLYALPNGNTIEQTAGRRMKPGDDWHFDMQHIAAQMRFLRAVDTNTCWLIAYLEASGKSWPAWRRKHAGEMSPISAIIDKVKRRCGKIPSKLFLSGHSGGGSFIFGYLNEVENVPDDLERIAFLDSTYAYDPALGHAGKLVRWLSASEDHCLSVLAYNDAVALLDGKPFVSATGGTWYRSQLMQTNLASSLSFTQEARDGLRFFSALDGRVSFILKDNPEGKIFHTVQVERNGFLQTMLSGTAREGKGYVYFGARAYDAWIGQ